MKTRIEINQRHNIFSSIVIGFILLCMIAIAVGFWQQSSNGYKAYSHMICDHDATVKIHQTANGKLVTCDPTFN